MDTAPGLARAMQICAQQKGAEDVNRGAQAYQAWLGYYNGLQRKIGWSPAELVATANQFSRCIGIPNAPTLPVPVVC